MSDANANAQNDLFDGLLGDFLDESDQLLVQLNERMLQLDQWVHTLNDDHRQPCDAGLLNEMFRAAHSLKGLSAMLGLADINNLTHRIENVFDAARKNELAVNGEVTELVFKGLDQLVALIEQLKEPGREAVDCQAVVENIGRLLQTNGAERQRSSQADLQGLFEKPAAPAPRAAVAPVPAAIPAAVAVNDPLADVANEADIPEKYLAIFIDESETTLDLLGAALAAVDHGGSGDDLKALMGAAHKIKGAAACIGLNRVAKLAHLMEDALQERLETHSGLTRGVTDVLLKCTDLLGRHVVELKQGVPGSDQFGPMACELLAARAADSAAVPAAGEAQRVSPASGPAPQSVAAAPARETPENGPEQASAARPATEAPPRGADTSQRPVETIRVDIDRLDHLMDLAGQLVISKAQFTQVGEKLRTALSGRQSTLALSRVSTELERMGGQLGMRVEGGPAVGELENLRGHVRRVQKELEPLARELQAFSRAHDFVDDLFEALHQLGRVSDGIQQSVMDTRMVPIGPLFARFKRVVRDITRSTGKEARLEIRGENTELDKRMIDELGDPLVHLVRNSVDHGIESPEARQAAGKPREGTVTLDAFHRGNNIVIEVRDDGKGLDARRILQKCVEKGLVTAADAAKLPPQQIYQKIWEPGLSTAEKVTEVSGRGMGMDIVKSKIEALSGTVDIGSLPGQGTTITLKLPLTLAILPSLLVEIAGDVFAVPMETVLEIVGLARGQACSVQGRPMANVRGRVVSLLQLGDVLAFHGAHAPVPPPAESTLVIVGGAGQEVGLAVDRVIGEADVVIKSLAENYRNVRGIAGASILGDGRVSLILDIPGLVEIAHRKTAAAPR